MAFTILIGVASVTRRRIGENFADDDCGFGEGCEPKQEDEGQETGHALALCKERAMPSAMLLFYL